MILTYEAIFREESDFTQPLVRRGAIEGVKNVDRYGLWAARDPRTSEVFAQFHTSGSAVIGDPQSQLWEALILSTEHDDMLFMIAGRIQLFNDTMTATLWSHDSDA